ncbi:MAG: hypothetical protein HY331_06415 [Chloroflexi bacterium]|nr:hypothetical protein [Chloroflexota bacterium]
MQLAVPLAAEQVGAATALCRRMPHWEDADRALTLLGSSIPGFDFQATLLKTAVVNQLLNTNVFAVVRMAEHIANLMAGTNQRDVSVDLVEKIADLPATPGQKRGRMFISFASKFAHFFVSRERFPIYDYYADETVGHHLGRRLLVANARSPYQAFVANVERLQNLAGLSSTMDELDAYLWLSGLYRHWLRTRSRLLNSEARRIFEDSSPEIVDELKTLLDSKQSLPVDVHS